MVTLNNDFAILHGPSHAAFGFHQLAELLKIGGCTDESRDQCYLFAGTHAFVERDFKLLLLRWQG